MKQNKRMKRAILKRKIKIALLSIVLAVIVWILINNSIQSNAEVETDPYTVYMEYSRPAMNGTPYSNLVKGSVVKTTAYCSCEICCGEWANKRKGIVVGGSGKELAPNYSVAADKSLFAYGDIIYLDGQQYRVDDCGGAIKGLLFDVYCNTHEEAKQYGVQYRILEVRN